MSFFPPYDFRVAVQNNEVPGWSHETKFGQNPSITTGGAPEDIHEGGGVYAGLPSGSAETIEVFSSDANDTAAGTGARTYRLIGIDATGAEQTVDVTLNGVTGVLTTETWLRCPRGFVLTAGSSGFNEGVITVRHSATTANIFQELTAEQGQTGICVFTVPLGKTALLETLHIGLTRASAAAGTAQLQLQTRSLDGPWLAKRFMEITTAGVPPMPLGLLVPARSDVRVRATDVSATSAISAALEYYLIDD